MISSCYTPDMLLIKTHVYKKKYIIIFYPEVFAFKSQEIIHTK